MKKQAETVYKEIKSRIPARSYLDRNMTIPDYAGYATANLPASICNWLGVPQNSMLQPLAHERDYGTHYRHIIEVIIDGLGIHQMEALQEKLSGNPWLKWVDRSGIETVLTSITPSSTAAALTTLWTGVPAGRHGLAGYDTWLRDQGMVVNFLQFAPSSLGSKLGLLGETGLTPETILPVPTLGQCLTDAGVISRSHMPIMLARSNLTIAQMAGTAVIPYRQFGDLWHNLTEIYERDKDKTSFDAVYWNDLDTYNHLKGMKDPRILDDLDTFFKGLNDAIEKIAAMNGGEALVLITADHGHIENTADPRWDLKNYPELMNALTILPCGENRLTYFYPKPGMESFISEFIDKTWPDEFYLVSGEQLIADGLYGPPPLHPDLPNRIGSLIAIARNQAYFWWPKRPDRLFSRHGGLSDQEMLVPLTGLVL